MVSGFIFQLKHIIPMLVRFDNTGEIEKFESILNELEEHSEVESLIVMAADGNDFTPDKVNAVLQRTKKTIIGGIFPEIIFETSNMKKGTFEDWKQVQKERQIDDVILMGIRI